MDDGTRKPFPCCSTQTGSFSNNQIDKKTENELEFEETFGPGIVVYFRLLKYLICMFILFTLLSLPPLIMYAAGTDDATGSFNSKDTFSQFSLGNLGSSSKTCTVGDVNAETADEDQITLVC
jgi:hypothetical protein